MFRILTILVCLIDSDGGQEEKSTQHVAGEELPSLAKEVAQVESVRAYAGKFACFGVKVFSILWLENRRIDSDKQ